MSIVLGIEELIKQHLPEALGKELKKVLSDYEKLKEDYKDLQFRSDKLDYELNSFRRAASDLESKNNELKRELEKHESLAERENKLEVTLLKKDVECQREKFDSVMKLTETVFRNPVIKKDIYKSDNLQTPYTDNYGNRLFDYKTDSSSTTSTTTVD